MSAEGDVSGFVEMEMVTVKITRDQNNIIFSDVLPDEVPVLKYLHREENVEVQDEPDPAVVLVDPSAEVEFYRLGNKFNQKDEAVIRAIFPRGPADLADFGFKVTGSGKVALPSASVSANKPKAKAASKK